MSKQGMQQQLQQEYRNSALLQAALPAALTIVVLYLVFVLFDQVDLYQQDYKRLSKQQGKLQAIKNTADWPQLLLAEQQRSAVVEELMWHSEVLALGKADIQTRLNNLLKDKISALRVRFTEPAWVANLKAWQLDIEITGRIVDDQVQALILELSDQKPKLMVEGFSYAPQRSGLINIQLRALLIAPEPDINESDA